MPQPLMLKKLRLNGSIMAYKKGARFFIRNWKARAGNQEIPGVTGKFGLEVQNESGQRLTEFCQENTLVI